MCIGERVYAHIPSRRTSIDFLQEWTAVETIAVVLKAYRNKDTNKLVQSVTFSVLVSIQAKQRSRSKIETIIFFVI